jgi:hypothetical protein
MVIISSEKFAKMIEKRNLSRQKSIQRAKLRKMETPQYKIYENLKPVRFSNKSGSHVNCVRIFKNNTWEHEFRKFQICWELLQQGHSFLTEAIFEKGEGRADILDLNDGTIIEVVCSESSESLEEKVTKYPQQYNLIHVDAKKDWDIKMIQ